MATRPKIAGADVNLGEIVGICPADGWFANFSNNQRLPVVLRVLLRNGDWVGLVGEEPQGKVIHVQLRAADKMENFSNYWRA